MIDDLLENPNVNKNIIDFQGENGLHCMIQCFISKYSRNQIDYYMNSVHVLLQKNPFLVTRKNNSNETPIEYAVRCKSTCPGDRDVWIKDRKSVV